MLDQSNKIYFTQLAEPKVEYEIHVLMEDGDEAEWLVTAVHFEHHGDAMSFITSPEYRHRDRRRRIVAVRQESSVLDWFDPTVVRTDLPTL